MLSLSTLEDVGGFFVLFLYRTNDLWDMICVFIDIILSEPDRPVRLEVGGSYASLEKKKKAIFDRSQFKKKVDFGAPPQPPELAPITAWEAVSKACEEPAWRRVSHDWLLSWACWFHRLRGNAAFVVDCLPKCLGTTSSLILGGCKLRKQQGLHKKNKPETCQW